MVNTSRRLGFTLIELMVAIVIFAIISTVSYRMITSLVRTKEIAGEAQEKWGNLSLAISNFGMSWNRVIPLVVRDQNGGLLPAVYGKAKLNGMYDSQLEMTLSGFSGDRIYGTVPPKRIGYRYYGKTLYLVTWPVLNRVVTTQPDIDVLIDNVTKFEITFLYPDNQWRNTWPPQGGDITSLPRAVKVVMVLASGETVERSWALT
ncbi:type II secretion system minor pseudopilin GspJ [Aquella oligotrophica]|nr:type II secretion system minor pseudopilin GspJ [Aquella oligotrophica]